MVHKLAFVGFGAVGQGLAAIIRDKQKDLKDEQNFVASIVAITDQKMGSLYHPQGLDIHAVLDMVEERGSLLDYPETPGLIKGWDSFQTIRDSNADTVVEVTYTNVHTGQPAIDHCQTAFESGKNVVMTNKGPVALKYKALSRLAQQHGVAWGFEGTVMSGTPTLKMPDVSLAGNQITEIRGIMNGTSNYILTKMEAGMGYQQALAQAQTLGYAEADPTSDVEGYDAMYKIMILANVIMGISLKKEDVFCQGIDRLTPADIEKAASEGKKWKMIAKVKSEEAGVQVSVQPEKVPLSDPLASISGALNAITYECDLLGPVTVVGAGAGISETGFALLNDLIHIDKNIIKASVSHS